MNSVANAGGMPVEWNMEALSKAPKTFVSEFPEKDGVKSIFFEGVPFRGKPTRVFAYIAVPDVKKGEKVPGMVLVHGGLGSAFRRWVKYWRDRGYAAISMDTCGCVSGNEYGDEQFGHRRHEWAGPAGWGRYETVDEPVGDQWMYHAVASVVLAHSLLRSLPEVDQERIGLTGVSWGGILACVAAGIDHRFAFAAPVYGCGFMDNGGGLKDEALKKVSREQWEKWNALFDPSHYLPNVTCQFLWIDGTNDFAFSLEMLQKSVACPKTPYYRATRVRMGHGHGAVSEETLELAAFADFKLKKAAAYPFVRSVSEIAGMVNAEFDAVADPIQRAELNWTSDTCAGIDREWKSVEADVEPVLNIADAELPPEAAAWFVNGFTANGKCVSSEVYFCSPEEVARREARRRDRLAVAPPALPDGIDASVDFAVSPGPVRPELHAASFVTRPTSHGYNNDDAVIRAMRLSAFRTHDAPLVSTGQRIVDTHFVFPLMHLDAGDPKNYFFDATDHFLEINFNLGMKCFYRLGSSIEHTGDWGANTLNPPDHAKYAEALAGIVRHYVRGWANGHHWLDKMMYWELFNEPDCDPCWRGTRAEFIDLFVTCLKRLKTEFPEIKVGGPAFTHVNEQYVRDLLAACKAAGTAPDFISWHCYCADPRKLLAMPDQMRRICADAGFPDCELVLNEWHYVPYNSWDGVQGASSQEALERVLFGPGSMNGIDSAAFTVQVETGFHDTPLNQSYFYGCGYNGNFGYVDNLRRPTKVYYGLQATGEVVAACSDRAAAQVPARNLSVFAAWTNDRKGARLLVTDIRGKATEIKIAIGGLSAMRPTSVRILDNERDLVETDDFAWSGDVLTLRKAHSGSAVFLIALERITE